MRRSYPRALPTAMATRRKLRWPSQPKEEKLRLCEKGRSFFQICPDIFLGKKRENTHELYQRGKGMLLPQAEPFYSRGAAERRDCGMSCEKYRPVPGTACSRGGSILTAGG